MGQADDYLLTLARSLEAAGDTRRSLAVLDLAAAKESAVADALSLKGDLLRARGELLQAAAVFDRLARQHPDHARARYLSALLCGADAPPPPSRPAPWPPPFVRLENFLERDRHDELLSFVTSDAAALEPSTVGGTDAGVQQPRVDHDVRMSFRILAIDPVALWLRPRIEARLAAMTSRLGLAPFTPRTVELKCTVYADGSFFRVHSDSRRHPTRRISFIYYFHHMPKRYSGGALLLYDGDVADPARFFPESVTRLDTVDNSLVFFPSSTHHEVTPVVSPSGLLTDARFTFAGHVHVADESAMPDTPAA
jgi:SM-20-related protein